MGESREHRNGGGANTRDPDDDDCNVHAALPDPSNVDADRKSVKPRMVSADFCFALLRFLLVVNDGWDVIAG